MNCPTDEALAALAVGGTSAATRAHVASCPACAARFAALRTAVERLESAHAVTNCAHASGRARLLAALAEEPVPVRPTLLWRVLMDRRTWVTSAAASAAVFVAVLLGWGGAPAVALADGLKPFKEAKSFSCEMIVLRGGKPADAGKKMTLKLTWAAPGSLRSDMFADDKLQATVIAPEGKAGIVLDHRDKTFLPDGKPGRQEAAFLKLVNGLAAHAGGDQKPAGTDEVGGAKAPRFDLEIRDPEAKNAVWRYRLWVHPETKRPVRVEFALQAGQDPTANDVVGVRLEKFEWDVKAEGLFDTKPPAGYKSAVAEK
ncbi:anti-sigma factor family protein [Frigoriglobus tundricola]|uniref:Zinc-finger domain-containing protein n=1 Tax=Frigoriglobus tundricola TaxID=2774151 RepID=A0A6M5YKY9_9BACT|nr:hypothetical protein [Frigoriglobus tundricola]QJW94759.1 hypothetical protein FTUN_2282 [Frigoriglobus tundricola]